MEFGNGIAGQDHSAEKRNAALHAASAALGEITSVIMRSRRHAAFAVGNLEALLMPALLKRQFLIVEAPSQPGDLPLPGAVLFWAEVSPEVDARLQTASDMPLSLSLDERTSGDIVWITDVAGDPRMINTGLDNLMRTRFSGRSVKLITKDETGAPMLVEHRR